MGEQEQKIPHTAESAITQKRGGVFVGLATTLTIIASIIAIFQFLGIARIQCVVSVCSNATATATPQGVDPMTKELQLVEGLVPGVNVGVYQSTFGTPVFINHDHAKGSIEYVFVGTYFYLDAVVDSNGEVLYFAVTTRNKAFHPVFKSPGYPANRPSFQMTLGVTTFAEVSQVNNVTSDYLAGCVGAHSFSYYEMDYLGRPGAYEYFGFGLNEAGYSNTAESVSVFLNNPNLCTGVSASAGDDVAHVQQTVVQQFRAAEPINTYAVSAGVMISDYVTGSNLGVDPDQVRLLTP